MRILLQLGLSVLTVLAMFSAAQAGEPHDAGFKARGLKDAPRTRAYYSSPAPVAGRQSFSYAPSGDAAAAPAGAPAPVVASTNSYRAYSYSAAPVQSYRSYRSSGRGHSGLSGDYGSKATLYK